MMPVVSSILKGSPHSDPYDGPKFMHFVGAQVFYFERVEGGDGVPKEGGYPLSMASKHFYSQWLDIECAPERETARRLTALEPLVRRSKLRAARLRKVKALAKDIKERELLRLNKLRQERDASRGCRCQQYCNPYSCACALQAIACQVDDNLHPCGCKNCFNPHGRVTRKSIRSVRPTRRVSWGRYVYEKIVNFFSLACHKEESI